MENAAKRERTRASLKNALIELCDEKPYYDITIWDICNRSGTYRSTFYRYYETKDQMLREIEHDYLKKTQTLTSSLRDFSADASDEKMAEYLEELTADMDYHMENEKLCRFLLSPAGDLYFYQKMKESIATAACSYISKIGDFHGEDVQYRINFFAAGFIDTIHTWLQCKNCRPEQIARFLMEMLKLAVHS